jgi:FAD/FMN-containing dehydrogenase
MVIATLKINNDIVVPKARIPALFDLIARLKREVSPANPSFGHVGDGNIHVNLMVPADDPDAVRRARQAEEALFRGVLALEGSISGEHGIGFSKARYLGLELVPEVIALMKRVKHAFEIPNGFSIQAKIFDGPGAND